MEIKIFDTDTETDVGSIQLNFVATKLRKYEIVRNYEIHFVATKLSQMEPTLVTNNKWLILCQVIC